MNYGKTTKRLMRAIKPHFKKILSIVFFLLLSTGIGIALPFVTQASIDEGFAKENLKIIIITSATVFVLYALEAIIDVLKERKRLAVFTAFQRELKGKAFNHLMHLPTHYYKQKNCAEILQTIEEDIDTIVELLDSDALFVISGLFGAVGGAISLFQINWKLAIIVLLYVPIKIVFSKFLSFKNYRIAHEYISLQEKYSRWFGDALGGVSEVRQYGLIKTKMKEFEDLQSKIITANKRRSILNTMNMQTEQLLEQGLLFLIFVVAGFETIEGHLTLGGLVSFTAFTAAVTAPLSSIINVLFMVSSVLPSAERYFALMDMPEEPTGPLEIKQTRFDIRFDNVCFSYDNKTVLDNASFSIPFGKKVAIIGRNGAGKTTLLQLLQRNINPEAGNILLCNKSISEYDITSVRKKMAVVSQDVYLFNEDILKNIRLNSDISDAELNKIIHATGLDGLINEKSAGETIGSNGALLSGGQKQRIAIARALAAKAPIVIFDEATSNLDVAARNLVLHLMSGELQDNTLIFVTHDVDFLKNMDIILLINEKNVTVLTEEDARKVMDTWE